MEKRITIEEFKKKLIEFQKSKPVVLDEKEYEKELDEINFMSTLSWLSKIHRSCCPAYPVAPTIPAFIMSPPCLY